ncbi:DUF4189 domain-containing protein [Sphingosinicella sp. BN140058]|uniref:DUF4189 domain-containing protein n=1 Tax=Sphingosinicella sp. BN140058 TaxID=1892855 RepID=UPI0013ED2003|nr:DUF4189 domain-containing protein [Sphingosinicella sp. BN140058]
MHLRTWWSGGLLFAMSIAAPAAALAPSVKISAGVAAVRMAYAPARRQTGTFGALAVDRTNGYRYGFSYDYTSRAAAEKRALAEVRKRGGSGTVVLAWSGRGCAAYRTVPEGAGNAYGWGIAATRAAADRIASAHAAVRSKGKPTPKVVWACNSKGGPLKKLYDSAAGGR